MGWAGGGRWERTPSHQPPGLMDANKWVGEGELLIDPAGTEHRESEVDLSLPPSRAEIADLPAFPRAAAV